MSLSWAVTLARQILTEEEAMRREDGFRDVTETSGGGGRHSDEDKLAVKAKIARDGNDGWGFFGKNATN